MKAESFVRESSWKSETFKYTALVFIVLIGVVCFFRTASTRMVRVFPVRI